VSAPPPGFLEKINIEENMKIYQTLITEIKIIKKIPILLF
jgi:hypothetical protein